MLEAMANLATSDCRDAQNTKDTLHAYCLLNNIGSWATGQLGHVLNVGGTVLWGYDSTAVGHALDENQVTMVGDIPAHSPQAETATAVPQHSSLKMWQSSRGVLDCLRTILIDKETVK